MISANGEGIFGLIQRSMHQEHKEALCRWSIQKLNLHCTQNQSRIFHPEGLYKKMIMMTTHQIYFSACQGFLGCSEVMEGIAQICLTSSL